MNGTRLNGSAINVFGRIKSALGIFCAVGSLLETDADGYPITGNIQSHLQLHIDD